MSGSINFPPVSPITQPNELQKSFFPFSAFSADDPNKTSMPWLRLTPPWKMSVGSVVSPLGAIPSGNVAYNLPAIYPAQYQIYIPAAYLVASAAGPFALTISTPAGGSSVIVPILKNGDTLLSGNLFFSVYVDPSGNVTSDSFSVSG